MALKTQTVRPVLSSSGELSSRSCRRIFLYHAVPYQNLIPARLTYEASATWDSVEDSQTQPACRAFFAAPRNANSFSTSATSCLERPASKRIVFGSIGLEESPGSVHSGKVLCRKSTSLPTGTFWNF